jgi:RES domain-containing protein
MTIAWRLVKERHIEDAFSGEGASVYGGRWNHVRYRVVYVSEHLSLAILEQFVHISSEERDIRFAYIRIEIPDKIQIENIKPDELPRNWREEPSPNSTKEIGTNWVIRSRSAILRIPSVIIPIEYNFALNPLHADFRYIKIGRPELFSFDPRMWK